MNYDWIAYCDICGQRYKASQMTRLSNQTGKGGLIVCKHDVDEIDYGLIPYLIKKEQNVPYVKVNHTNTDDGSPIVDLEDMTLIYYLTSSQDGYRIISSQDSVPIISPIPL